MYHIHAVTAQRTIVTRRIRLSLCLALELCREGFVVEKHPGVIELVIPRSLEILHGLYHALQLTVPNQRQECRAGSILLRVLAFILGGPYQLALWLADNS